MGTNDDLASYRRCAAQIAARWPAFQERRRQRLRERERFEHAAEKATEAILEDLFTEVLDWSIGDVNHQVGRADITLTSLGIKYLIVEAKAPGALTWSATALDKALEQARGYADEQKVRRVAASDGVILQAADVQSGGLRTRLSCRLDGEQPLPQLWWLSVYGIYRERPRSEVEELEATARQGADATLAIDDEGGLDRLLHPKYKIPAACFAYVGDAGDTSTWSLPYRTADGNIDGSRLPKAIQAIISNYRGARVSSIPEAAIPDVLVRLACAANEAGKLPASGASANAARVYLRLVMVLEQLGRLDEVRHD